MPDQPRAPQGPGTPDEPKFDWLYGGGGTGGPGAPAGPGPSGSAPERPQVIAPPPSDDPEPTRMMRVQPRPEASPAPASPSGPGGPPRPGGLATAERPQPAPAPARTPKRSRWRWVRRVLVLWLVFLIAVPIWAWSQVDKVDATPAVARPADQPGTTYLLVGSDSRANLSAEERRKLGTGDAGGQRTDTIMLLHTGSGPNLLLSIPRDSLVAVPGHGTTKINAAFAFGGPKLLTRTIEQNTGVRIDDYVQIGMGGVVDAVDAVGGVQVCTDKKLVDKLANLNLTKGCHQVDGATALAYTRSRHTQRLGDIDRAKNQRAVVSQVGDKVKSPWTILNPIRYLRVAKAGSDSLTVNKGMQPWTLLNFAWAMTRVNGTNGLTCSMPIRDQAIHWDRERALKMMNLIKTDRTADIGSLCTASGFEGQ